MLDYQKNYIVFERPNQGEVTSSLVNLNIFTGYKKKKLKEEHSYMPNATAE